jgi:hypothetical protein
MFNAQNVKKINVQLVKNPNLISKVAQNLTLTKEELKDVITLQDDEDFIEWPQNIFNHSAVSGHSIVIKFLGADNETMTLSQANLANITIYNKPFPIINTSAKYVIIKLKKMLDNEPSNKETIKLNVSTHGGNNITSVFKYINGWQPYNFLNNKFGLWFPVNMYSTSFEKNKNGVRFTAMPIGLAIGGKYNISQDFYFGISGTINYTLTSSEDENNPSNSVLLQDFSFGPLLDLGGYAYFGYTFPVNLTNQENTLKPQFVIGIGTKITELLTGKK